MPTHITLPLDPEQAAKLPRHPGRALHALFYQWIALGDYQVSVQIHDSSGPRPFTAAFLEDAHNPPALRFTLLDDDLWPVLEQGLAKTGADIAVLGQTLKLSGAGPQVTHCTYVDLLENAFADTRIRVKFHTPTSFRSREMHYPLPDPVLVFQSWLNRWNEFAPEPQQINVALLDIVAVHIAVSRYSGHTEMVDFGGNKRVVGFVGSIHYTVLRPHKIGLDWLRWLNTLADYALFCGTGHKTAQGMGVTTHHRGR